MLKIICKLIHIVLLHAHIMTQNAKQSFVSLYLLPYSWIYVPYVSSAGFNYLVMNVPVCHSVIETVQDLCLQMLGRGSNGSLTDVKTLIKIFKRGSSEALGKEIMLERSHRAIKDQCSDLLQPVFFCASPNCRVKWKTAVMKQKSCVNHVQIRSIKVRKYTLLNFYILPRMYDLLFYICMTEVSSLWSACFTLCLTLASRLTIHRNNETPPHLHPLGPQLMLLSGQVESKPVGYF